MRLAILIGCLNFAAVLPLARSVPAYAAEPVLQQAVVNVHTVEEGETVRSIAAVYGVSSQTILAANAIEDPDLLTVGQKLVVPSVDGSLHTVQPGETLRAIADEYGVNVPDLVTANALNGSPDLLTVGTVIVVPGARTGIQPPDPVLFASDAHLDNPTGMYVVREGDTLRSVAEAFNL